MSADHRTTPVESGKPTKPYPDFPLFPHATKRWAKKIRGKMHYFGPWDDPDAALAKYLKDKDALHAGRKVREVSAGVTVKDVANAFLTAKQALVDSGELSPLTWRDHKLSTDLLIAQFGKSRLVTDLDPDDFSKLRDKLAPKWGPHRLAKVIQHIRSVFKHAYEADLITTPIRFGPAFKRPSAKVMRLNRAKNGGKLFTVEEIRGLLKLANVQVRAMIYLGVNCGFGNSDCGNLPLTAIDLDAAMIDYPRPKTGVARRCPLWPETVAAIRAALADRPEPKDPDHAGLVFITKYGQPWAKDDDPGVITKEVRKLLNKLGTHRPGLSFYSLRHTFRTIADEAKDQPAADFIMGHESTHMSSHYRERISDDRLKAVTDHVRAWLLGKGE